MRKWILGFAIVLFGVLTWFLLIRPYDFTVSFKANTLPEIVNQSVKVFFHNDSESNGGVISYTNVSEFHFSDNEALWGGIDFTGWT